MGELRKIEVELDETAASVIDGLVAGDRFSDAGEVIRHALGMLAEHDRQDENILHAHGIERLRAMIDEGLGGEPVDGGFDAEAIKRNGRMRLVGRRA